MQLLFGSVPAYNSGAAAINDNSYHRLHQSVTGVWMVSDGPSSYASSRPQGYALRAEPCTNLAQAFAPVSTLSCAVCKAVRAAP